ncbi:MAG: hypothetical protein M1818_008387 [Claussenomyces sp. TS43310]|nr:MAG: hypothetical protein M1818_008387 [Claussenomyces sp. TS43310]
MGPSRIAELASTIQHHTSKVDAYLVEQGLPSPSFDVSTPGRLPLPPHIQASSAAILEATDELNALISGPVGTIARQAHNSWASVQAIQRFGIATSFPVTETSTFDEIARKCEVPESDVRRILRHAMTYYVFREPSKGVVAHTAASKALAQFPLFDQFVGFLSGEMWTSATRLVDAMITWPGSEEPNEAGFALAFDTDKAMFDVVGQDPMRAQRMSDAMTFMHSGPGYSMQYTLDNYDWGDTSRGLLVDVGGGHGSVAMEIARHFPEIKCIVQDLPDVIRGAKIPSDLKRDERLTFMAHDFFKPQPVQGADVYLFRWILHDWSDKYAVDILRNLIPALKKGSRVLISELCVPPPGTVSPFKDRSARNFDIAMKEIQNAKERDFDDWTELFEKADSRFRFRNIIQPPGSILSMIDASWDGEAAF